MKSSLLRDTVNTGARIAQFGHEASRVKSAVSASITDAVEDGAAAARRAVRRGAHAAEDLLDEAAHRVKRSPLRSVAIAFGAGALIGWVITRLIRK
ncbi:MAG TPA: hypothetical protein VJH03_25785 [Blastocatellia bacterium]|nr:hypothetical protein [Blastocatellia bacterium]